MPLRSPLGEVQTDDLKKSITRETTDKLLTTLTKMLIIESQIHLAVNITNNCF